MNDKEAEGNEESKSLDTLLIERLRYLDETRQRLRNYNGRLSSNYEYFFSIAINMPGVGHQLKAGLMIDTIFDAFQCGYKIGCYLLEFKEYCESNKVGPTPGLVNKINTRR